MSVCVGVCAPGRPEETINIQQSRASFCSVSHLNCPTILSNKAFLAFLVSVRSPSLNESPPPPLRLVSCYDIEREAGWVGGGGATVQSSRLSYYCVTVVISFGFVILGCFNRDDAYCVMSSFIKNVLISFFIYKCTQCWILLTFCKARQIEFLEIYLLKNNICLSACS